MMSVAAKPSSGVVLRERVPQHAGMPDLPPELARAYAMTAGELSDRYLPLPGEVAIEQAKAVIPAYAAADQPTTKGTIEGWLDRVALAVANAPDPDGLKAFMAAFIALSGDLPQMCWTMETWRAFLGRGPEARFWPCAAEVDLFLRPIAERHRAKLATLRRMAAVGTASGKAAGERQEPVSEAARMTLAERDAAITAIRAKHGIPRSSPASTAAEAARALPAIHSVPVAPAVLQALRDRRRAALGLAPVAAPTQPTTGEA